jgi:hypothetical protein
MLGLGVVLVLSGCCGVNECNGPEGSACTSSFACLGSCVDGFCRDSCSLSVGCGSGRTCYVDQSSSSSSSGTCLPPPAPSEKWTITIDSLSGAIGSGVESGDPDDFVCLGITGSTYCSQEQTGFSVTYARSFVATFTTEQLSNVSVTVFDSNDFFTFGGCEGACDSLQTVSRNVVHAEAIDARPLASRKKQQWSLAPPSGLRVNFSVEPW